MSVLEIVVTRLGDGHHSYAFKSSASDVGLSESFRGEVLVSALLERRGRQFLLSADARGIAHYSCDRCLREFDLTLEGTYCTLYVTEEGPRLDGQGDEEIRIIPGDVQVLKLADDVRQTLELAEPSKRLCRDECKGLCPTCGKDLNEGPCGCEEDSTDPRWEPLKQLSRLQGKER